MSKPFYFKNGLGPLHKALKELREHGVLLSMFSYVQRQGSIDVYVERIDEWLVRNKKLDNTYQHEGFASQGGSGVEMSKSEMHVECGVGSLNVAENASSLNLAKKCHYSIIE